MTELESKLIDGMVEIASNDEISPLEKIGIMLDMAHDLELVRAGLFGGDDNARN
mgnify:CR=1 FL=1|jgi:hypothetical protein